MGVILTTYESWDDFASRFPPKMENFPIFHGKFGRESRLTPCPEGELALGDVETLVVSCNKDGEKRLTPGDFPEDGCLHLVMMFLLKSCRFFFWVCFRKVRGMKHASKIKSSIYILSVPLFPLFDSSHNK